MDSRPTLAEIDLAALRYNYQQLRRSIPETTGILAVVKADAYGHGFMDISRELELMNITAFGVAFLAEGIQLRKAGIDRPILLLGGIYPGQERKCVGFGLSTIVFTLDQARALDNAAARLFRKAHIHLKVDTGMGRLGIDHRDAADFLRELKALRNIQLEGIVSHFASADELDEDGRNFTEKQSAIFSNIVKIAREEGFTPRYIHLANSAATVTLNLPFCNMVRPGIALYGAIPSADFNGRLDLRPVMRLKSRIAMVKRIEPGRPLSYARTFVSRRETLVASVPVGYADGYCRSLSNRGEALVRGKRARVAGTVCMDWIMLDVTDIPNVAVGDEVILLGRDETGACIRAEELAEQAGTIPYELFCGISKRVPRMYLNASP